MTENKNNNTWWDYIAYFLLTMMMITSFGASRDRQKTIIKQNERIIQQNDSIKKELEPYLTQVWDINTIREQFKDAIDAAKKYNLQLFCGEWGVYEPVDRELAYKWTKDMLTVFDEFNIAWTTWCYDADFGFWDQKKHDFKDKPLVDLLMESKGLENK